MIGVVCEPGEAPAVREFFELFKTPWAMAEPGAPYDAVIVSGELRDVDSLNTGVVMQFCDRPQPASVCADGAAGRPALVTIDETTLPLYLGARALSGAGVGRVRGTFSGGSAPVVGEHEQDGVRLIRCGYDLFGELALLLSEGQPPEYAATPTLDRHIALIRRWLVESELELVELHPAPPGCDLMATLTHDIDFLGIRRHTRDKTLLGFLYRATVGSVVELVRGRRSIGELLRNWLAVATLPLVYAGVREDFWLPFGRYAEADAPASSTFFVVPFRDHPGLGPDGRVAASRGVPYAAGEIASELRTLAAQGHEIALHGIDAWRDADLAGAELAEIRAATGADDIGVRMHWLYFDGGSFARLDDAGFDYDATFGYNDAVGFRAGTAQVFAPLGTRRLLALPLHVQDTALLYPTRMHLRPAEAVAACDSLIAEIGEHGGVATLSWHERSLSPERLWDGVYARVRGLLRAHRADMRTARQAVAWFRTRRTVNLEGAEVDIAQLTGLPSAEGDPGALRVRIHHGAGYTDLAVAAADLRAATREHGLVGG